MTSGDGIIVSLLELLNSALKGQIPEKRIPFSEKRRLPQPRHASVPVGKRMNENKFIMENRGQDQRMNCTSFFSHPCEKGSHVVGYKLRRRSHKNAPVSAEYSLVMRAEYSGFLHGQVCHDPMQFLKIQQGIRIELPQHIICQICIWSSADTESGAMYS